MHILLGLLGIIVTILVLLKRLADAGIDLGGLNPFLWHRRRKWRQKIQGDPIYAITSPMEAAALLVVATARCDGDISSQQKAMALKMFEDEFHLPPREAAALLGSSVHLLKDGEAIRTNLEKVLAPTREQFTPEQAQSLLDMMTRIAHSEDKRGELHDELITRSRAALAPVLSAPRKWN